MCDFYQNQTFFHRVECLVQKCVHRYCTYRDCDFIPPSIYSKNGRINLNVLKSSRYLENCLGRDVQNLVLYELELARLERKRRVFVGLLDYQDLWMILGAGFLKKKYNY